MIGFNFYEKSVLKLQYLGITPFLKLFFTFGLSLFDAMKDKKHTFGLAISLPKEAVLMLYLMTFFVAIGQNKKEQILLLTEERDSLKSLLNSERSASDLRIKELNSKILELENQNKKLIATDKENAQKSKALEKELGENKVLIGNLNNELILLKDSIATLKANDTQSSQPESEEDELKNDVNALLSHVKKSCSDEYVSNKISTHISNRYEQHLHFIDSLRKVPEDELSASENMTIQLGYSNRNFLIYEVGIDGYYGGAHPETFSENYIFDLQTGDQKEVSQLIIESSKNALINLLNQELKKLIPELNKCMDSDDFEDILFSKEYLNDIEITNNGIQIEYYTSHLTRVCNPIVAIEKSRIKSFFISTLFE